MSHGIVADLVQVGIIFFIGVITPTAVLFGAAKLLLPRAEAIRVFIRRELFSALVGIAVSTVFFSFVGKSEDETLLDFARGTIEVALRGLGMDDVSRCIYAVNQEYRFDARAFADDATQIGPRLFGQTALYERDMILAIAGVHLLMNTPYSGDSELLNLSVTQYCSENPARLPKGP